MSAPLSSTTIKDLSSTGSQSEQQKQKQQQQQQQSEEYLRKSLRLRLQKVTRREPLDPSYKAILLKGHVKPPHMPKDKLYKKLGIANLREKVESFMSKYGVDNVPGRICGRSRDDLPEGPMRAAFTLRECKKHVEDKFIEASLAASLARRLPGSMVDEGTRKRKVEAMALGLQEREKRKHQKKQDEKLLAAAKQKILAAEKAVLEKEKARTIDNDHAKVLDEKLRLKEKERLEAREREIEERERLRSIEKARERERERETERKRAEEEERIRLEREREEEARRARMAETPKQALHRLYEPIFRILWDMEFGNLNGTNPFRIVIDKNNCAAMGVPDYCDVIETPMNLTYIQEKVNNKTYETLKDFFDDVELLIGNALLYNSDPHNEFHIAALQMKKKFKKLGKRVMMQVQHRQSDSS